MKHTLTHRLKIACGHLDRVVTMVETDAYCIDVIHQSMAVQASLKAIDEMILQNHMKTCVANEIRKGNTQEVIDEVMKVMEKKRHG